MNTEVKERLSRGSALTKRRPGRVAAAVVALAALALMVTSSASASGSATATLAPIGTGSYLLSVTNNTVEESIKNVFLPGNEATKNAISSNGGCFPLGGGLACNVEIPPKGSVQICYSGTAVTEVVLNDFTHIPVTGAPAVGSCPLAGFTPASATPPPPAPGGGGGETGTTPPASAPTRCKKGFVMKKVHGKSKCVKRKHGRKKHKH